MYDNLGGLYKEMEDLNDALTYYVKANKYAVEAGDQKSITLTLVNMAGIFHKRGSPGAESQGRLYQMSSGQVKNSSNE